MQSILKFFLSLLNLACPHICTRIKLLSIVCGESGWLLKDVFLFLGLFRILKMVIYIKIYKDIPIFLLFSVQNSYFFPIFWDHEFLFSYFFDPSCYLTPCKRFQGPKAGPGSQPSKAHFICTTPLCSIGKLSGNFFLAFPWPKSWIRYCWNACISSSKVFLTKDQWCVELFAHHDNIIVTCNHNCAP